MERDCEGGVEPISVLPVSALLLLMVIWCMRSEMKVLGYKHGGSASEWYGVFLWMQISSGSSLQVSHSTQHIMWEKTTPLHSASWTFQITSKSAFISSRAFSSFQRPCAHLHYSLLCYHAVLFTVTLSSCMEPQNRTNDITFPQINKVHWGSYLWVLQTYFKIWSNLINITDCPWCNLY